MEKPKGSLISFMANKVKAEGGINLAQGIPAFNPPKELLEILKDISDGPIHQYAPGIGNHLLLDKLASNYKHPRENFLIVNGATEAISLLFIYLKEKVGKCFSVLGFDPVYESYKHLPRIFNVPFVSFPLNRNNSVDFDLLETEVKGKEIKLIVLSSPGNPFGKVWHKNEMVKLIEIANRNGVYLIVDAVYSELYFREKPYFPVESIAENIFYVNAFSKKLSITGWRIGYLLAHKNHMPAIMDIHDYTGLCAPSVLQQAIGLYLDKYNNGFGYIEKLRETLAGNYNLLVREFEKMGFNVFPAEGGYFVWAKLPTPFKNGLNFALELYAKEKVAVVPGIHFSPNGKSFIRINIARYKDEISKAVIKIQKFIDENS